MVVHLGAVEEKFVLYWGDENPMMFSISFCKVSHICHHLAALRFEAVIWWWWWCV